MSNIVDEQYNYEIPSCYLIWVRAIDHQNRIQADVKESKLIFTNDYGVSVFWGRHVHVPTCLLICKDQQDASMYMMIHCVYITDYVGVVVLALAILKH